ncbi:MAG: glycosyltransferase family 4 protein [Armatimonadota bacterium]|nr:glycosyltransferase family 4 protein [Armatimonadota bacterium]
MYQLVRELSRRHRVTLLTYGREEDSREVEAENVAAMREVCAEVVVVPPPRLWGGKRGAQALSLLSRHSFQMSSLRSPAMQAAVTRLLSEGAFDLIQVESSQMAGFDFGRGVPIVLDEHNLEYELLYRLYKGERSPGRRLYNWAEYVKFHRQEQACWRRADACLLTSGREQEILNALLPDKPAAVIPNGVDIEFYQPTPVQGEANHLVFTGLMSYRPNIDGAVYFVKEVLPRIHQARPGVTVTIVGAGAGEEVERLAGPGVVVTGAVPDTRAYFARASAVIVPLRMGSGTRLKVLEGLAMGKPLISTSVGCEGIHVCSGEHLLIADDPQPFADAVLRVLTDTSFAEALGRQGRALVEREYGWAAITTQLEAFYAQVLSGKSAAAQRPA